MRLPRAIVPPPQGGADVRHAPRLPATLGAHPEAVQAADLDGAVMNTYGGLQCLDHAIEGWPIDQDCPCVEKLERKRRLRLIQGGKR